MKKFFSIVIATYNSERTLENALLSLLSQEFQDFEIIIVDGGSKDSTMKIVDNYSTHISVKISEKDQGIYDAWNKGIRIASGQWISFLGSDDFFYPGALQKYANAIKNSTSPLDYVSSKVDLIDSAGKVRRTIGRPWNWKDFRTFMCVGHVGSMHNSSLYSRFGEYDISYKITGDYEFLLRPGRNLKAGFLDEVTTGMQIGGVSSSFKVYKETFKAKRNTGKVSIIKAAYDWLIAVGIFYGRKIFKF